MFLQHFDYFRYHSNHNFHLTTKKNDVHNQHIATCSHTKFHEVSSNSFRVISGSICFYIILTISVTIATTIFILRRKKMTCIISTLPPIHTPSFMKVARIVFELLQDPDFIGQTDRQTDGRSANL